MISLATPPAHEIAHEPLVDSLRAEIEEYGGLLALFEDQQAAILARNADRVLALAEELEQQVATTRTRRQAREKLVVEMISAGEEGKPGSIMELLPLLREPVRPLVEALKDEVNRLITHTRRRAQQNQMLLARTVETSQELLRRLNPEAAAASTYSPQGRMKNRVAPRTGRLLSRS